MPRISPLIEKWENKLSAKFRKHSNKLKTVWPLILIALYFYGVIINSVKLGIASTFPKQGAPPIESIWVWNPVLSLAAIFTPHGIGITLFLVLMMCLFTKKGYSILSGYRFERDPRGFDILPDGTHGTGGWMKSTQMDVILQRGKADEVDGTILGKIKDADDDDKYAEYVAPKEKHQLNDHIMVFGASGTGKSRGFVKPFILQAAKRMESIVLVDPKSELFETTSQFLKDKGYVIRAYNLLDLENSDGFNCLYDIEKDPELVRTVSEIIIKNTSNAKDRQGFWETAEKNLLTALLYYMSSACDNNGQLLPIEKRSLGAVYNMLASEKFSKISELITDLPPGHPAKAPFDLIKETPVQNRANIIMGLGNRLGVFQNKLVDCITKYNDIDLALPGQRPCAYYCIISDQDSSLEFLSSLFFSLLFSRLSNFARRSCKDGRLPVKVNICLEEFCNIGALVDFKRIISVIRSRNIACQIVIQGAAQISDRYPHKEWEEIVGNCDWQLFLGCNDQMTADYISEKCGKVTIRTDSNQMPQQPLFSPVYNSTKPYSITRSSTQRYLMMPDELLRLDNAKSIVLVRGQRPIELYKITPEELPAFNNLKVCRVVDHIPAWREIEARHERERQEAKTIIPTIRDVMTEYPAPEQQMFFDSGETAQEKPIKKEKKQSEIIDDKHKPYMPGNTIGEFIGNLFANQKPIVPTDTEENDDSRG